MEDSNILKDFKAKPSWDTFIKDAAKGSPFEDMTQDQLIQKMIEAAAELASKTTLTAKDKFYMKYSQNIALYGNIYPIGYGKSTFATHMFIKELLAAMVEDKDITEEQADAYLQQLFNNE